MVESSSSYQPIIHESLFPRVVHRIEDSLDALAFKGAKGLGVHTRQEEVGSILGVKAIRGIILIKTNSGEFVIRRGRDVADLDTYLS